MSTMATVFLCPKGGRTTQVCLEKWVGVSPVPNFALVGGLQRCRQLILQGGELSSRLCQFLRVESVNFIEFWKKNIKKLQLQTNLDQNTNFQKLRNKTIS
jgi:hypothetical protein